ncbi:MAG: hypothetical protein JKY42_11140 [Flavobacteriales bacterium]|nr:hypothetical protein [Flavobacteriales bacterium]
MKKVLTYLTIICLLFSCRKVDITKKDESSGLDNIGAISTVVALPDSAHEDLKKHFSKYINIMADNGQLIHIIAQSEVSNDKVNKVANVLRFYFKNYPSGYGTNKSEIANKMAENKAALYLFNDEDSGEKAIIKTKNIDLNFQVIYEEEIMVDGSKDYVGNSFRDATYEEVLHLVQDYGIAEILPEFQKEIRAAADDAIARGYWISVMIPEWEREGSIETEYLATILDVYYGFWQNSANDIAFNGEYFYSSREAIRLGDPLGYTLMNEQFFPPYLDYEVSIYSDFQGIFRMVYDTSSSYTSKSQYLRAIRLTGDNNSNVLQNSYDNYIVGNNGVNTIFYTGNWEDYDITLGNPAIISDSLENRDGTDTLKSIEFLQFSDTTISN